MLGAVVPVTSPPMATRVLRSVDAPRRVYVRGVDSNLGTRVLSALAEVDGLDVVVGETGSAADGRFDTIVELGVGDHDTRASRRESVTEAVGLFLADAEAGVGFAPRDGVVGDGVRRVRNNPVPITEESVLRPDPEFVFARQLASAEELVEEWRRGADGRSVTVLRPALAMAEDGTSSLVRALAAGLGHRFGEDDPVAQFVHLDDVASAVALVGRATPRRRVQRRSGRLDPRRPSARAHRRSSPASRCPSGSREVVGALRWRFQRGPIPPGLGPYTREPWVVANDKLRSAGWTPTVTNEQTYVEGTESRWWTMVTPKRRQELSLGAMVGVIAAVSIVGFSLVRRSLRRRRARRSV